MTTKTDEIAEELAENDKELKEAEKGLEDIGKIITKPIDEIAEKIVEMRKRPLLVLYWHDCEDCEIDANDHKEVYKELRKNLDNRIFEIDVLIHTLGGSPDESYQIAKAVREFSDTVTFLIPEQAISGGTIIVMSGNQILLADCARLSPIDIQYPTKKELSEKDSTVYLSKYVDFVKETMDDLDKDRDTTTGIEKVMIEHMVKELGTLNIARIHRMKHLAYVYGNNLLKYAFPRDADIRDNILTSLIVSAPAHDTVVDYEIAKELQLPVDKMELPLSDATKELLDNLSKSAEAHIICKYVENSKVRNLFCRYYPTPASITEDIKVDGIEIQSQEK